QSVLEAVDPKSCRLAKSDRAQMSGNRQAALVGRRDQCLKLRTCERRVCLKRRNTLLGPARHLLGNLLRVPTRCVDVGAGDVYLRSRKSSRIDETLDAEITREIRRAGRANRRDAAGEVEPGELLLRRHSDGTPG